MRDFPIFLKGDIFRVHLFQIVSTIINILLLSGLPKKLYTNFNNIQRDRCSPSKTRAVSFGVKKFGSWGDGEY